MVFVVRFSLQNNGRPLACRSSGSFSIPTSAMKVPSVALIACLAFALISMVFAGPPMQAWWTTLGCAGEAAYSPLVEPTEAPDICQGLTHPGAFETYTCTPGGMFNMYGWLNGTSNSCTGQWNIAHYLVTGQCINALQYGISYAYLCDMKDSIAPAVNWNGPYQGPVLPSHFFSDCKAPFNCPPGPYITTYSDANCRVPVASTPLIPNGIKQGDCARDLNPGNYNMQYQCAGNLFIRSLFTNGCHSQPFQVEQFRVNACMQLTDGNQGSQRITCR